MKPLLSSISISILSAGTALSATTFLATNSTDLNDATNWSNELPSNGNAGTTTADGEMSADFGNGSDNLYINSTISTNAFRLSIVGGADRLHIGNGTGNIGSVTVNSGGELYVVGASQDVRIGGNSGYGTLTLENGSTIDARKSIEVYNGILSFGSDVSTGQNGLQTNLLIGGTSTLEYAVDASGASHTFAGSALAVTLDTGSTLNMNFAAGATSGTVFTLVDSVASVTGSFSNITNTGLAANQTLEVALSGTNLNATVVTIPEPSSSLMIGLGGLALILRRRK